MRTLIALTVLVFAFGALAAKAAKSSKVDSAAACEGKMNKKTKLVDPAQCAIPLTKSKSSSHRATSTSAKAAPAASKSTESDPRGE